MAFTTVICTGTVTSGGSPVAGAVVQCVLNQEIYNSGVYVQPTPLITTTNSSGIFAITLLANDDPGTRPAGSAYVITITSGTTVLQNFAVVVPSAQAPTTNLLALTQVAILPGAGMASGDTSGATDLAEINGSLYAAYIGGGGIVELAGGNYWINAPIILYPNVWWRGKGEQTTIINLANGANCDMVQSYQFASLTGTNTTSGIHHYGIEKIGFNGNRANQTAGDGVKLYGYSGRIRDIDIASVWGVGFWSEWGNQTISGSTTAQLTSRIDGFSIHDCGSWGMEIQGPHDSYIANGEVYRNAQTTSNKGNIFTTGFGSGIHFDHVHAWGSTAGNGSSWSVQTACFLNDCVGEGGSAANLQIGQSNVVVMGGDWFTGSGSDLIGIQINNNAANYMIITKTTNLSNGAIYFNQDGGNGLVMIAHDSGTKIVKGTPAASTVVMIQGPSSGTYDSPASIWALQGQRAAIRDNGQSGMLAGPNVGGGMAAANIAANDAWFVRFVPSRNMTITKIAVGVATAASVNDSIDVGIFDTSGNLLGSAGSTAAIANATGAHPLTLTSSVTLTAGTTYYAALAYGTVGGTAANFLGFNGASGNATMFGSTVPQIEWFRTTTAFPLATNSGFSGFAAIGAVPLLALRES